MKKLLLTLKNNNNLLMTATVFVAFTGAYLFSPEKGIIMTIPFAVLCAFVAALIPFNKAAKTAFFIVFPLIISLGFGGSLEYSLICCGIYTGMFLLCTLALRFFRTKKRRILSVTAGVLCICTALGANVYFGGNPFGSAAADRQLSDYVSSVYNLSESELSKVFYDYKTGSYALKINGVGDPTNIRKISVTEGIIEDGYLEYLKAELMRKKRDELQALLHADYENESFTVVPELLSIENKNLSLSTVTSAQAMSFKIIFNNEMTSDVYSAKVANYVYSMKKASFGCREITFIGGEKGKKYAQVRIIPTSAALIDNMAVLPVASRAFTADFFLATISA